MLNCFLVSNYNQVLDRDPYFTFIKFIKKIYIQEPEKLAGF